MTREKFDSTWSRERKAQYIVDHKIRIIPSGLWNESTKDFEDVYCLKSGTQWVANGDTRYYHDKESAKQAGKDLLNIAKNLLTEAKEKV